MLHAWNRFQAVACRVAAVVILGLGLAGCFDIDYRVAFQPAGSAAVEFSLRFDQDMEEVAALLEAYARYSPDAEKFKDGLCVAAQRFVEAEPQPSGKQVQARQFRLDDRFICQFRLNLANAAELEIAGPDGTFEVKAIGQRRYSVSADLSKIPDFSRDMQAEFLAALRDQLPPDTLSRISESEFAGLWGKHVTAAAALTRIFLRNRYVQLTIAAPRIVETNGTMAADKSSVSFRLSFAEVVTMALDANARKGKKYYAVIEY